MLLALLVKPPPSYSLRVAQFLFCALLQAMWIGTRQMIVIVQSICLFHCSLIYLENNVLRSCRVARRQSGLVRMWRGMAGLTSVNQHPLP
jgi:hypothetical protein